MGEIEQTNEVSDYRQVDGVKAAFGLKVINPAQTLVVRLAKVSHQKSPEDAMFSRPK